MNHEFVETLPRVNTGRRIILSTSASTMLVQTWLDFGRLELQRLSEKEYAEKSKKDAKRVLAGEISIFEANNTLKDHIGLGPNFKVVKFVMDGCSVELNAQMTLPELVDIYFDPENPEYRKGYPKRAVIDKYFATLWNRGLLLYPLVGENASIRSQVWKYFVRENEIMAALKKRFEHKPTHSKGVLYRMQTAQRLIVSTSWQSLDDIMEGDLQNIEKTLTDHFDNVGRQKDLLTLTLNEIRYMLIDAGRDDIEKPRDRANAKKGIVNPEHGVVIFERFEEFSIPELYPHLLPIKLAAENYLRHEYEVNGLAKSTIDSKASILKRFFTYLTEHYRTKEVDVDAVDEMFDPAGRYPLLKYLEGIYSTRESAIRVLKDIVLFLVFASLYSAKARKNTPRLRGVKVTPYRAAMPKEMYLHLLEILKHRPPSAPARWSRGKADVSWWPHDVYPVLPMIMLLQYLIPLRGGQIRNLDRKVSFEFDHTGRIKNIIVNTDKNYNRKKPHVIPCVWEDIQNYFVPFLKWHHEYFSHIPRIRHNLDKNSPWPEIEPLFVMPEALRPMSKSTHMDYHKRLLCVYQLEVMKEAEERGGKPYPVVAWMKDGSPFFKSVEEIDRATTTRMSNVAVAYDIHSLRVTGTTRYLESGLGIKMVMTLTGHQNANTTLNFYVNMTREEQENALRSAVDRLLFDDPGRLMDNASKLVQGELSEAYAKGPDALQESFSDNGLKSFFRKAAAGETRQSMRPGTEIASERHPSLWVPLVCGICPGVRCPEGREHRCSLCPYLITGRLFLRGVLLRANQAIMKFFRISKEIEEDGSKGYVSHSKTELAESILEEIMGWQEIIADIDTSITQKTGLEENGGMPVNTDRELGKVGVRQLPEELAYLANAYDAKLIGAEQDSYGMKVLTIKALRIAMERDDSIEKILDDPKRTIDYLMSFYANGMIENFTTDFVKRIEALPVRV